jgi:phospholipid/cholesterol/gamma-HCH transport system substrate-binding protein
MFSRLVKTQLVAFAIIAVVAVIVVALQYLHLPRLLGFHQVHMAAEFNDGTGIYTGALVTLRGVEIGKVQEVDLHGSGALVRFSIDQSAHLPADTTASILSTSAIGEQYLELTPHDDIAPYLKDGDTIGVDKTVPQQPITNLLVSVTKLAASVPSDNSRIVLNELGTAFQGSEMNVRELLSAGETIVDTSVKNVDASVGLVQQLPPFLGTQTQINSDVQSLSRDLSSVTGQLVKSDGDLRAVVNDTPPAANEVIDLERRVSQTLPILLDNLTSTGEVIRLQLPNVTQTLVLYPAVTAAMQTTFRTNPDGKSVLLGVRLNVGDPPPCYSGFIPPSQQRAWDDLSPAPLQTDMYCKVPPNDPRAVRGARNIPCANDQSVRRAYFEDCLNRPRGSQPVPSGSVPVPTISSPGYPKLPSSSTTPPPGGPQPVSPADWATTYDPRSGLMFGPDGQPYQLGGLERVTNPKEETWKTLVLK